MIALEIIQKEDISGDREKREFDRNHHKTIYTRIKERNTEVSCNYLKPPFQGGEKIDFHQLQVISLETTATDDSSAVLPLFAGAGASTYLAEKS